MDFLERIKFFIDPQGIIEGIINKWNPEDCKSEKEFEKSLLNEFYKNLKTAKIQNQYGFQG